MSSNRTIGTVLDESRGLGQGFDFLRVLLAFGVVTWHTPIIAAAASGHMNTRFLWFGDYAILDVFFALSGFLIAGSALRLKLGNFLVNRGLRIFPALAVEIVLSALVLGTIFTTLPKVQYLTTFKTLRYFTNIVGLINYHLPGVFESNPVHEINISLWTVPYELGCYAIMSFLMITGLLKKPWAVAALGFAVLVVGVGMFAAGYRGHPQGALQTIMDALFYGRGSRLFISFLLGIAIYLYRYKIPYSLKWFGLTAGFSLIVAAVGSRHYAYPPINLITIAPLVYVMAFLGVTKLPKLPFFHRGDYSYGIYLYGWPVMQAMRGWFPSLGSTSIGLWLISLLPIVLFAAFSWHTIELPILNMRKKFSFVARQRIAQEAPKPELAGGEHDQPILKAPTP